MVGIVEKLNVSLDIFLNDIVLFNVDSLTDVILILIPLYYYIEYRNYSFYIT